jgi:indolepyruvate ferredoxin oxidoreductase beta subunit
MTTNGVTNILLVGVGGQGIILASEIIAEAAMRSGLDACKSEVHGMSQRGGVVSSHVRFGPKVYSPLVEEGNAHLVCAFEVLEALRWLHFLAPGGHVMANTQKIVPPIAAAGLTHYPDDPAADLLRKAPEAILVPAGDIAAELGNARLVNSVMLGRMAPLLPLADEVWRQVIGEFVPPKARELNLKAYERGRSLA